MTKHSPLKDRLGLGRQPNPVIDTLNLRVLEQRQQTFTMQSGLTHITSTDDTGHYSGLSPQVKTLLVVRNGRLEARFVPEDPFRQGARGGGIRPVFAHPSMPLEVASLPPRILVLGEIGHASGSKRGGLGMPIRILKRRIKLLRWIARALETLQAETTCLHCTLMGKSTPSPKGSAPHGPSPPPTPPAPPATAHARPPESQARP